MILDGSENADNTTSFVKPKILPIFSADEQNCQPHCQKNQFKCPNSSTCVPLSWLCDSIAGKHTIYTEKLY